MEYSNNQALINVLLLDLSGSHMTYEDDYNQAVEHLEKWCNLSCRRISHVEEIVSLNVLDEIRSFDVMMLWLGSAAIQEVYSLYDYVIDYASGYLDIVILDSEDEEQVQKLSYEAMQQGIFAFACPFNPNVLYAYIKSSALDKSLEELSEQFDEKLQNEKTQATASLSALAEVILILQRRFENPAKQQRKTVLNEETNTHYGA
jgi:hypothetical protein